MTKSPLTGGVHLREVYVSGGSTVYMTGYNIIPYFERGVVKCFNPLYFFLSARAGGILQILRSDWLRERAVFSHPARSQRAVSDA